MFRELNLSQTKVSVLLASIRALTMLKKLDLLQTEISSLLDSIGAIINLELLDLSQTKAILELSEAVTAVKGAKAASCGRFSVPFVESEKVFILSTIFQKIKYIFTLLSWFESENLSISMFLIPR